MTPIKPDFLMKHPFQSGLIWAALFIPCVALFEFIYNDRSLDYLPTLIFRGVLAGIAWGYVVSWWPKSRDGPPAG